MGASSLKVRQDKKTEAGLQSIEVQYLQVGIKDDLYTMLEKIAASRKEGKLPAHGDFAAVAETPYFRPFDWVLR